MPFPPIASAGDVPPLFSLLAIMLVSVVVVSLLLLRFQRSLLVGYFVCGVLIANTGLVDWLGGGESREAIRQMAEFGVMLLMFVIGLEFSVSELRFLRRFALVGGGLQMGICVLFILIVSRAAGLGWPGATVLAIAFGMSSTAISLKSFQDLGLTASPGARFALGVAIFQDLVIIAFLVFVPLLLGGAEHEGPWTARLGALLLRGTAFVAIAAVAAKWLIPAALHAVARTRYRELFTVAVIGCCLGLAFVGAQLELSLALGAFVAGLAVSESVYKHRILADIEPIKDVFLTLFFVSVGLLVDLRLAGAHALSILLLTAALVVGKTALITGIGWFVGLTNRPAVLGALSLCSAGEFSLLLLQKAGSSGLWSPSVQQILLAGGTLSMALVPVFMRGSDSLSRWLDRHRIGRRRPATGRAEGMEIRATLKQLSGHAILCGYGPVGRALHKALHGAGIPTVVIELNVDTVRRLMHQGQPVLFADAAHEETWKLARVGNAILVAFTFSDASSTANALRHIRDLNPHVSVLARARFAVDQPRLERIGASVVIHDEGVAALAMVESALEMTSAETGARPGPPDPAPVG
jgi:CPA2 family monovalent cation:H+ antiporter-2